MLRRVPAFNSAILRTTLYILIGAALFLVTTSVAGATEAVTTPTAGEYARETAPVVERRPETSTADDMRLATGLSIAAVIVITTVLVSDRRGTATSLDTALPAPGRPAPVRAIGPAEAMPEAA